MSAPPVSEILPHALRFTWDGEDVYPMIECPYDPDDPTRPCRMFEDWESDDPVIPASGCGLVEHLDAGGVEALATEGVITADTEVGMHWDDSPTIRPWKARHRGGPPTPDSGDNMHTAETAHQQAEAQELK